MQRQPAYFVPTCFAIVIYSCAKRGVVHGRDSNTQNGGARDDLAAGVAVCRAGGCARLLHSSVAIGGAHGCALALYDANCRRLVLPSSIDFSAGDAGYRLSFEEYYQVEVKSILSSTIRALTAPEAAFWNRTFVWQELSYFSRWWREQDAGTRAAVLSLAKSGRFEFIGGGWVMHDEADTTYESAMNQVRRASASLECCCVLACCVRLRCWK